MTDIHIRAESIGEAFCTVELDRVPTKSRPRFDYRNKHTYTPRGTVDAEAAIRSAWKEQAGDGWKDYDGEVRMVVNISRPLPKSARLRDSGKPDLNKPDIDNTLKLIQDALNGVAYKDDKQITSVSIRRLPLIEKGVKARIEITCYYYKEALA